MTTSVKNETQKQSGTNMAGIEVGELSLTDIVDIDMLQHLQDSFAQTFNMPSIIYGYEGVPITRPSCFTSFCALVRSTKEGAKRCESFDAELIQSLHKNPEPTIRYGCALNNMVTGTVPINIHGYHLANWGIGQLINNDIDIEEITSYADTIGVNRNELIEAAKTLIPVEEQQFRSAVSFLQTLSDQISILGFRNLQQSTEITKRKQAEKKLQRKTQSLQIAIEDLQIKEKDIENKNIALKVLLDQKQDTRGEIEDQVAELLKKRVYPYLELLQHEVTDAQQKEYLALIKSHLDSINGSFSPKTSNPLWNLTPREILVADLVQQGKNTAEIAQFLKISIRTAEKYRHNIRKKMGLTNKKMPLHKYLNTLSPAI